MRVVRHENTVFVDVDDTLVMWNCTKHTEGAIKIKDPFDQRIVWVLPHLPHIKLLKNQKKRGSAITVWSQSGYQWADVVVRALGLTKYVDLVMTKPRAYVDDKPVQSWMIDHVYLPLDCKWGQTKSMSLEESK